MTFESFELKQRYIPHLKVLVCGINAFSSKWHGFIFILCYTHLNLALLLHKTVLVTFLLASTVSMHCVETVIRFLFFLDPDVAEDMYNVMTSTEAISRRRQRNEICVVLKRSSSIHHVYIGKNVLEILLVLIFLPVNITYALKEFDREGLCEVDIMTVPG